jgi:isopenicillin N synthase-like dioxygenase
VSGRAFRSVPIVDISGLRSASSGQRRRTAQALGKAARDVGFLYITGHGVPQTALAELRGEAERFFAQSLEAKMARYIGRSVNHSGYSPQGEETNASGVIGKKESYDVGVEVSQPLAPMLGPNQWPADPQFRTVVGGYYEQMSALSRALFGGFALALDLSEDHFERVLSRPPSQLRLLHYPHDPSAEDREGNGAHTDYECFTILASTAPGLEVMNDEGRWIDAPPIEGAFVINIGEMLEAWTNREFVATTHRVRAVEEERYSFPFFAACDYRTVVEPLPSFVTKARPAAFRPMVAGEHLFTQTAATFRYLREREPEAQADVRFGRHG